MESLALLAVLIISPAMFGGPFALLLTCFRTKNISKTRRGIIYMLSMFSLITGLFLILDNISSGATFIGFIGIASSGLAVFRIRLLHNHKNN